MCSFGSALLCRSGCNSLSYLTCKSHGFADFGPTAKDPLPLIAGEVKLNPEVDPIQVALQRAA